MALCCCIPLAGQDYQQIPEGIKATINSVDVELQFYTPSIVRILKSPNGWKYTKESLSVVEIPQKVKTSVTQEGNIISLKSSEMGLLLIWNPALCLSLMLKESRCSVRKENRNSLILMMQAQKRSLLSRRFFWTKMSLSMGWEFFRMGKCRNAIRPSILCRAMWKMWFHLYSL